MSKPKSIEESMALTLANTDLKNVAFDATEMGVDALLNEGTIKELPVVNWLHSIYSTGLSIHDKLYLKKIVSFLHGTSTAKPRKKEKFIESLQKSNKLNDIGERMLLYIDGVTDYQKAKILGNLYAAVINEEITLDEFYRLASIIERVYLPDLKYLGFKSDTIFELLPAEHKAAINNFVSLGLMTLSTNDRGRNSSFRMSFYDVTDLGKKLFDILK